jgi:branched-chain amino acid transport system ATP-binding protein
VFVRTSVQDNLLLGSYSRKDKAAVKEDLQKIYEMFPRLLERKNQLAGTLSGGEQQMLAMGRALMSRPKLLLLDEPSMGLSPLLVDQVFDTIVSINKSGTTVLLVEQNANQALRIAKRGYVIETGEIVLADDADRLLNDPKVKEAYLGG